MSNTIVTELRQWKFTLDQHRYGLGAGWATEQYDDSFWSPVETYTAWETYEYALADYEGNGWFRTRYDGAKVPGRRYVLKFDGVGGSPREGRFNERFGAAFLDAQLKIFMEDENMRGMVIWSWADYRHRRSFIGGGMHLSATYGPYGLVTIDRKVKEPIFNVMKDFYTNWNP